MEIIPHPDTGEPQLTLCNRCAQQFHSKIHRHDYKPRRFVLSGDPPFYGMELEVDHFPKEAPRHSQKIHTLSENETFFYIKRDGSLENGFELVFHPRSIDSWVESWDKVEDVINLTKKEGAKAWDPGTCGIHFHRSKSDLQRTDEIKLCMLLKLWKSRLITVAQRRNDRFANWDVFDNRLSRPGTKRPGERRIKAQAHTMVMKDRSHLRHRYQCINFGSNPNTFEFRIFKGTLHTPTIKAYLAFTHHFVEFSKGLLINEIDSRADCKSCMDSRLRDCATCQESYLWGRFTDYLYKYNKLPFVRELLDFLTKVNIGHEQWISTIDPRDWKEV